MALAGTIQIAGNANAGPVEVELNTLAERFVTRPQDFGSLGAYCAGGTFTWVNGMTAQPTPTSNPILAAFRCPYSVGGIVLVKKIVATLILFQAATGTGANVAYPLAIQRVDNYATQFINAANNAVSATLPQILSPTPAQKLKTRMPAPTADFIIPSSAAATAAQTLIAPVGVTSGQVVVPTISVSPIAQTVGFGVNGTNPIYLCPPDPPLFQERVGEFPFILDAETGFVLQFNGTTPTFAAGLASLVVSISVYWEELQLGTYSGFFS